MRLDTNKETSLYAIYRQLYEHYGEQGWWPVIEKCSDKDCVEGWESKYHPGCYKYPRNRREEFQICAGAILTQNTAWDNAAKALENLAAAEVLDAEKLVNAEEISVRNLIKPSGYYNIKSRKLKVFAKFYLALAGEVPTRQQLLNTWGIGPETADSIRLYAYNQPEMVVDAYTRRMLSFLGLVSSEISYNELKDYCCKNLPADTCLYQEFHALIVAHGKRYYTGKQYYEPVICRANSK